MDLNTKFRANLFQMFKESEYIQMLEKCYKFKEYGFFHKLKVN